LGKHWPALEVDVAGQADRVLVIVDDFGPTAIEEIDEIDEIRARLRIFFATSAERDAATAALQPQFHVSPINIPDDDWARRSQENLTPITVGQITVVPPWHVESPASAREYHERATARLAEAPKARRRRGPSHESRATSPEPITIVIAPSMGFGTGHHATTRLCLAALQAIDVTGAFVLDVGTGSGVLAIAAVRLGAARAVGLDDDPDAIQSAHENLALNPTPRSGQTVTFIVGDLMTLALPPAAVVTANLTGALLVRAAGRLQLAVRPGGVLIVGGLLAHERDEVLRALTGVDLTLIGEAEEDGWTTFTVRLMSK
jgi:ribosomal protein L11 methylase PrmA